MKSYNNLYNCMTDKVFIESKIREAAKGKTYRRDVVDTFEHIDERVEFIRQMMETESFVSPNHVTCVINESSSKKTRSIVKPFYWYEQVVHHMFVDMFKRVVLSGFYEWSCGSIPDRGQHYAKKRIEKYIHQHRRQRFYVLKLDVRHFYATIDRDILKGMLRKDIRDDKFYNLACKIIDYDNDPNGKGVPLGFYSSQWFGNYYLKRLDHFIKQELNAELYIRYVDDMVIFSTNKKKLRKMLEPIREELAKLGLELKENWQIFRFEDVRNPDHGRALDFLGFVFHRNRTTLRKSILRAARRKANRIWKKGEVTWYTASQMLSYCGWFFDVKAYRYFKRWILSKINVRKLKRVVSKHSRKVEYERLERMLLG